MLSVCEEKLLAGASNLKYFNSVPNHLSLLYNVPVSVDTSI